MNQRLEKTKHTNPKYIIVYITFQILIFEDGNVKLGISNNFAKLSKAKLITVH